MITYGGMERVMIREEYMGSFKDSGKFCNLCWLVDIQVYVLLLVYTYVIYAFVYDIFHNEND